MNECTINTDDCVDGATCMNTAGSFTCTCPPGFSGDGRATGTQCQGAMGMACIFSSDI